MSVFAPCSNVEKGNLFAPGLFFNGTGTIPPPTAEAWDCYLAELPEKSLPSFVQPPQQVPLQMEHSSSSWPTGHTCMMPCHPSATNPVSTLSFDNLGRQTAAMMQNLRASQVPAELAAYEQQQQHQSIDAFNSKPQLPYTETCACYKYPSVGAHMQHSGQPPHSMNTQLPTTLQCRAGKGQTTSVADALSEGGDVDAQRSQRDASAAAPKSRGLSLGQVSGDSVVSTSVPSPANSKPRTPSPSLSTHSRTDSQAVGELLPRQMPAFQPQWSSSCFSDGNDSVAPLWQTHRSYPGAAVTAGRQLKQPTQARVEVVAPRCGELRDWDAFQRRSVLRDFSMMQDEHARAHLGRRWGFQGTAQVATFGQGEALSAIGSCKETEAQLKQLLSQQAQQQQIVFAAHLGAEALMSGFSSGSTAGQKEDAAVFTGPSRLRDASHGLGAPRAPAHVVRCPVFSVTSAQAMSASNELSQRSLTPRNATSVADGWPIQSSRSGLQYRASAFTSGCLSLGREGDSQALPQQQQQNRQQEKQHEQHRSQMIFGWDSYAAVDDQSKRQQQQQDLSSAYRQFLELKMSGAINGSSQRANSITVASLDADRHMAASRRGRPVALVEFHAATPLCLGTPIGTWSHLLAAGVSRGFLLGKLLQRTALGVPVSHACLGVDAQTARGSPEPSEVEQQQNLARSFHCLEGASRTDFAHEDVMVERMNQEYLLLSLQHQQLYQKEQQRRQKEQQHQQHSIQQQQREHQHQQQNQLEALRQRFISQYALFSSRHGKREGPELTALHAREALMALEQLALSSSTETGATGLSPNRRQDNVTETADSSALSSAFSLKTALTGKERWHDERRVRSVMSKLGLHRQIPPKCQIFKLRAGTRWYNQRELSDEGNFGQKSEKYKAAAADLARRTLLGFTESIIAGTTSIDGAAVDDNGLSARAR